MLSALMLLVTTASSACGKTVSLPRAMWVWNRPATTKLISWANKKNVKELYVYVHDGSFSGRELSWLRDLRTRADAAGLRLQALGGEHDWIFDHAAAARWRRAVLASGLFSATHLDVEPHVLPEWKSDQAGVMRGYLQMLTAVRAVETAPARTSASRRPTTGRFFDARPLEADVAFWYGALPGTTGGSYGEEILSRVDGITVMSYRDRATGDRSIMSVGSDWLGRAEVAGKPVRLAAEVNRDVLCPTCTFYEEGSAKLSGALDAVDTAASKYGTYRGMAVHDYAGWTKLRR